MNDVKRFTLLLSEEQHAELLRRAGLVSLGTYIKSELFKDRSVLEHGKVTEAAVPTEKVKTCPHGVKRDWRCTLCGGVVK